MPYRLLVLLSLIGCGSISDTWYDDRIRDVDGDGVASLRFGGRDCDDNDPSIGDCDQDRDQHRDVHFGGDDCDDSDPAVSPSAIEHCDGLDNDCNGRIDADDPNLQDGVSGWLDADADGFGAGDPRTICADAPPSRYTSIPGDCDDNDASVFPGNPAEYCDLIDQDCDGDTWDGDAIDAVASRFVDQDQDLFPGTERAGPGCVQPGFVDATPSATSRPTDCDDHDPNSYPGAEEIHYDGIDQDCAGDADEFDADGDGFDRDFDCQDDDPRVFFGAQERCDGVDNDCNGQIDDDDPNIVDANFTYWADADGDGFGDVLRARTACTIPPPGFVSNSGDCNDTQPSIHPGADEICDGVNNDCDAAVDEAAIDAVLRFRDADGDGFGGDPVQACPGAPGATDTPGDCDDSDPTVHPGAYEICGDAVRQDCTPFSPDDCDADGYEATSGDCNDEDPLIHVDAQEVCDGQDNDCDGQIDAEDPSVLLSTATNYFRDADGDGFGGPVLLATQTCSPPAQGVARQGDCDDLDEQVYPGAPERCDDQDNDCNGASDDAPVLDIPTWYIDLDQDGFGDDDRVSYGTCQPPDSFWADNAGDCDDGDDARWIGAPEICDGIDNDCDGAIDDLDDDPILTTWYLDGDGDGVGQTGTTLQQCSQPPQYVLVPGDCNDTDPLSLFSAVWYRDADGDGYGDADASLVSCIRPPGYVAESSFFDCDDADPQLSPAALETCDTIDNDCNGLIDDNVVGAQILFPDLDGDGFGDSSAPTATCDPGSLVAISGDCDDGDATIRPGAQEVCDGFDNDCDGLVDTDDNDNIDAIAYADTDGDQFGDPNAPQPYCGALPSGFVTNASDCDDSTGLANPLGIEICDGIDNDCDGLTDDQDPDAPTNVTVFPDADGDGFGDPTAPEIQSCTPSPGFSSNGLDCDDQNRLTFPGAPERCDGIDNDCDLAVDDDDPEGASAGLSAWFTDLDGDGYGDSATVQWRCLPLVNEASLGSDCDDTRATVNPRAVEFCNNGQDDDCDTQVDEGVIHLIDVDGDGWVGLSWQASGACPPALPEGDCDDGDSRMYPANTEVCDGVDNDCDGDVDGASIDAGFWYDDADGDGFGALATEVQQCAAPRGFITDSTDCNDVDPQVFPGAFHRVGLLLDYLTIADAQTNICAGSTLILSPGMHLSPATIDADLSLIGTGNTVIAAPPGILVTNARLELNNITIDGGPANTGLLTANNAEVVLRDVDFIGGQGTIAGSILLDGSMLMADDITILNSGSQQAGALRLQNNSDAMIDGLVAHYDGALADFAAVQPNSSLEVRNAQLYSERNLAPDFRVDGGLLRLADVEMLNATGINAANGSTIDLTRVILASPNPVPSLLTVHAGTLRAHNLLLMGPVSTAPIEALGSTLDIHFYTDATNGLGHHLDATNCTGQITNAVFLDRQNSGPWDAVTCDQCSFTNLNDVPPAASNSGVVALNPMVWADCLETSVMHAALHDPNTGFTDDNFPGYLGGPLGDPTYYLDLDADGLPDGWERFFFGDLTRPANDNSDNDSYNNSDELNAGTHPQRPDTDGNDLADGDDTGLCTPASN